MNLIYNTAIGLYSLGVRIAAKRNVKACKMLKGQQRTFEYLRSTLDPNSRYIWIHVSSLGEFEQARPLIEHIKEDEPHRKIVLSFFSPSGYEVRKNYPNVDAVCYLPFDFKRNAREFVDLVKPEMAIFVKYEFWGNYLQELSRREIPTYLISAIFRPKQSFFQWWGGMFRKMLGCYTHLYVQDESSRRLLDSIEVKNVTVAGDTRFDRVTDIMKTVTELPLIERFKKGSELTFIAGSSWSADEDIYADWVNSHSCVKVIIAPHEFNESRLSEMRKRFNGAVLWSELLNAPEKADDAKSLIIDCFGLLASIYRYGDVAYVGGGFGAGIHNVNEAAVYGMPVIFGPKYGKFKEAKDLIAMGGAFSIGSVDEFTEVMNRLTRDDHRVLVAAGKTAGDYIQRSLGATEKIYTDIFRR